MLSNKNAEILTDFYFIEDGIHKFPLLSERALVDLGMIKYSAEGEFVKKVDARQSDNKGSKCKH